MMDIFTGEIVDFVQCSGSEQYSREPEPNHYLGKGGFIKESPFIVQQFTGLKDKNGKEIYEGDIVKYARTRIETIEEPRKVFSSRLIELGEDIGEIAFMGFEYVVSFDHKRYDDIEKLGNYPHRFEVIGNILENPELLNLI
jgi:uncharacterized phage protein (TIGR01671 family)